MITVNDFANENELKRIQFLVKKLELKTFRFLYVHNFKTFKKSYSICYEVDCDEYNRLSSFLNNELPEPKSKSSIIFRIIIRKIQNACRFNTKF